MQDHDHRVWDQGQDHRTQDHDRALESMIKTKAKTIELECLCLFPIWNLLPKHLCDPARTTATVVKVSWRHFSFQRTNVCVTFVVLVMMHHIDCCYLRRRLVNGEGIVSLGVCHAVCESAALRLVSMARVMHCIQCCLVLFTCIAGHPKHEWTSYSSFESVFKFFEEQYQRRIADAGDGVNGKTCLVYLHDSVSLLMRLMLD